MLCVMRRKEEIGMMVATVHKGEVCTVTTDVGVRTTD